METLIGKQLGNYVIQAEIGRGGMAVVYKAHQPALERYVAIKVLPQQFTFDREFVERFLREARAAARLNHPHIVTIHDVGQADGTYYIVMEYLEGPSLADLLRRQRTLPPQQVAQIVTQVASALDYAHGQGFVHRDVKPSNVLLSAGGVAKLTDFGIVRAAEGTRLTQTGTLLGTPEYMSPEQAKALGIDRRSDIYSLGVVAYEMLAGRVPFSGDTLAVLHAHAYEPPDLRVLPAGIGAVVGKALAKDPRQRFGSATALAQALEEAVAGVPVGRWTVEPPARVVSRPGVTRPQPHPVPGWVWGLSAVAVVAFVIALVFALSERGTAPVPATPIVPTTPIIATLTTPTPPPPLPTPVPTVIAGGNLTPVSASERSGCIVFDSYLDDNWEVCVMNPDGSGLANLTNHPADDGDPAWSPDGRRIAFDSDRDGNWEVYTMNADGSAPTRLTDHPADDDSPAWSPDGQRIAFKSDRDGNWEIYAVNVDSSGLTNLTNHPSSDRLPAWSPDGKCIAFTSDRDGDWEIYVMNADGSGSTNLTNHPEEDWFAAWSPDGQQIAFHSYRDGDAEIYVMNADGSGLTRLTYEVGDDWGPCWSPDGLWIAFTSDRDGDNEIYVMSPNGDDVGRLTNNDIRDTWPDWAPIACAEPMYVAAPTLTSTSTPVPSPTLTPTSTPAPSPTPCGVAVHSGFMSAWNRAPDRLGCPTRGAHTGQWIAEETFERGRLFWRQDNDHHYVLYANGAWERFPNTWLEGMPVFTCGTPESPPTPLRGFGKVWCDHSWVREGLGNATTGEWGEYGTVQDFVNGGAIMQSGSGTYVLYADGTWERR